MEKEKVRRLTIWAAIMIVLSTLVVVFLDPDQRLTLLSFFKDVILLLILEQ